MCMRRKVEENEVKSKENEKRSSNGAKCDGGMTKNAESESEGESNSSRTEALKKWKDGGGMLC